MSQYFLYGVTCQGIQSFVFETDKLQEIVGGSELVEQLCTSFFTKFLSKYEIFGIKITGAAGNIRYIFEKKSDVEKLVLNFPEQVIAFAPGIAISQAVVSFEDTITREILDTLEEKLKAQCNRMRRPSDIGFLAVERCRRTARPAVRKSSVGLLDASLDAKREAGGMAAPHTLLKKLVSDNFEACTNHIPFEMEDMIDKKKSGWLAVIHADGNNLGKIIQGIAEKLHDNQSDVQTVFRKFSEKLDASTVEAAQKTFGQIILQNDYITPSGKFPIRPIVIGGDDLTVICRADLAIDFTQKFLEEFQNQTKNKFEEMVTTYDLEQFRDGLTACAGIAFVKPKYPFHFAAKLAEDLCAVAKKSSKENDAVKVPSSLAFYKVQSSFIESYQDIVARELTVGNVQLNWGPYTTEDNPAMPGVNDLLKKVKILKDEDAPASSLRKWITILGQDGEEAAAQYMNRIQQISPKYFQKLGLYNAIVAGQSPIGDWLSILSLSKGA